MEMFASKNKIVPSIIDGLGMGVGFTATLLVMGMIREFFGAGSLFGIPITAGVVDRSLYLFCRQEVSLCLEF